MGNWKGSNLQGIVSGYCDVMFTVFVCGKTDMTAGLSGDMLVEFAKCLCQVITGDITRQLQREFMGSSKLLR